MSAPKGGSRPGAGKPSNATRHATRIETFTDKCAGHLRRTYDNLRMLADGKAVRVETEWAKAGTVTRKDVVRDADGNPRSDKNGRFTIIDVQVYPDTDPDKWVRQKRKVIELPPEFRANEHIADRVMGKPRQAVDLGNQDESPLRIEVAFEAAVSKFYPSRADDADID